MIKVLKNGDQREHNIMKAIHEKLTDNIVLNAKKKKLKQFAISKMGMRQGSPLFPLRFNPVLKAVAEVIRREKKLKIYK